MKNQIIVWNGELGPRRNPNLNPPNVSMMRGHIAFLFYFMVICF